MFLTMRVDLSIFFCYFPYHVLGQTCPWDVHRTVSIGLLLCQLRRRLLLSFTLQIMWELRLYWEYF